MRQNEGIIEFICEGGAGGEANVKVELRTKFPGIGGTILTHEGVASALREEHSPQSKSGHRMFLRHMILKKFEDYFYRKGAYKFAHITRPLGSISRVGGNPYEAYLYEWAFGIDRFAWEFIDDKGNKTPFQLNDWNAFVENFTSVGVDIGWDCTDPEDGTISQNIVHQYPKPTVEGLVMNCLWKRIDFGYSSIRIDFDKVSKFLHDKREDLINMLRSERYQMLLLAVEYLTQEAKMREADIGRLEIFVGDYRCSSLRHYTSRGVGLINITPVYIQPGEERLV